MITEALLQVRALETAYGASQVLFGIDLDVRAGETIGLLGRNGMGKTTLVRSIFGLVRSRSGSIRFDGRELNGLSPDRIARSGLALVPEGRQVFPNLSVHEHLTAFAARRGAAASPGLRPESTSSFLAWPTAAPTWATSCRAANSRCWRSDVRWSPIRAC